MVGRVARLPWRGSPLRRRPVGVAVAPDAAANAAPARPGAVAPPVAEKNLGATTPSVPVAGAPPAVQRPPLPDRPAVRRPEDVAPEPRPDNEPPRRRVRDRLARRI